MTLAGLEPVGEGTIERDGVRVRYQVFGSGSRTILLLPTWSIVHSDFWRHQVPHFAGRYKVLTFDGRGNGASDRPPHPHQYAGREHVSDALAVMDAVGIEHAAIASNSIGAVWCLVLAAEHRDRVSASIFISPTLPLVPPLPERLASIRAFDEPQDSYEGWFKNNRHYWHIDWPDYLRFFFSKCFTEPGSEVEREHFLSMGLETTPESLAASWDAPMIGKAEAAAMAESLVGKPVLVIHGDADAISPTESGRELARLAGAELVILPGSGHEPECRIPDRVNALMDDFLTRAHPP